MIADRAFDGGGFRMQPRRLMDVNATRNVSDYASPATPDDPDLAPPRVWPAVLIIALFWAWRWFLVLSDRTMFQVFMGILLGTSVLTLVFLLWWCIDRRGRRGQRLVPVLACVALSVLAGL